MTAAPTSIQVLVIPADGSKYRYRSLETVRMDIKPPPPIPHYSSEAEADLGLELFTAIHQVFHYHYRAPQPNVSLLPDARKYTWDEEAWRKRAVYGTQKLHIFFTHSTRENTLNFHFGSAISGDAFLLKLSESKDEHGRKFYENLEPKNWTEQKLYGLIRGVTMMPKLYTDEVNGGKEGPKD